MNLVEGHGYWAGKASGQVVWIDATPRLDPGPVVDRQAQVNWFRLALTAALAALERWAELQSTVEGRLLVQGYQEALANIAWSRKAIGLIDREGMSAPEAALQAAQALGPLLSRSLDQVDQARNILAVAQGLSEWLVPRSLPEKSVVAASDLSTLVILALDRPVLLGKAEAPPGNGLGPVVWGVPGLSPAWNGCWVSIEDGRVEQRPTKSWVLYPDRLNEMPLWRVDGKPTADPIAVGSVALVSRLDDLAAVPLLIGAVGAVAVDLDALVNTTEVNHPGTLLLLRAAAGAAQCAGIPFLAGGCSPYPWSELGFTGLYHPAPRKEGSGDHAL